MRIKAWGHRKDDNHGEIEKYFRDLQCKTKDVSSIPGFCDLIVKRGRQVRFVEIKDPTKPKADRKLTAAEARFHKEWGDVVVVETFGDVLQVVEGMI